MHCNNTNTQLPSSMCLPSNMRSNNTSPDITKFDVSIKQYEISPVHLLYLTFRLKLYYSLKIYFESNIWIFNTQVERTEQNQIWDENKRIAKWRNPSIEISSIKLSYSFFFLSLTAQTQNSNSNWNSTKSVIHEEGLFLFYIYKTKKQKAKVERENFLPTQLYLLCCLPSILIVHPANG